MNPYEAPQPVLLDVDPTRRNIKVSHRVLALIQTELLRWMDKYGDDMIPPFTKEVYLAAGVNEQTFYNNFACLDNVHYWSKVCILKMIQKAMENPAAQEKPSSALWITMTELASNPVLTTFATRRFSDDFWMLALKPLRVFVNVKVKSYPDHVSATLYGYFVSLFRFSLRSCAEENYSMLAMMKYVDFLVRALASIADEAPIIYAIKRDENQAAIIKENQASLS